MATEKILQFVLKSLFGAVAWVLDSLLEVKYIIHIVICGTEVELYE